MAGDWRIVSVLKKTQLFQIASNTVFDLKNYSNNIPWGTTQLEVSISSVDMGYDVTSLEVSYESLGNNQYKAHIYRYKLIAGTPQVITVPITGNYNQLSLGQYCGGVTSSTKISNATGIIDAYVGYATPRYPTYNMNQIANFTGIGTSIPVTVKYAPPILGDTILYYAGGGNASSLIEINYTPYYLGSAEEVSGTVTVLAMEVED